MHSYLGSGQITVEKFESAAVFFTVRATVTKTEFFENALQTGGISKRQLFDTMASW